MDHQKLEEIFNQTFPGISFLYRDVDLSNELIAKYQVGQIIHEKGFTDTSKFGGGLDKSLRYLIASAHGKDLSVIDEKAGKWGLVLIASGSYFKVLDICEEAGKTQIQLLHIPKIGVELFSKLTTNVEEQVVEMGKLC